MSAELDDSLGSFIRMDLETVMMLVDDIDAIAMAISIACILTSICLLLQDDCDILQLPLQDACIVTCKHR